LRSIEFGGAELDLRQSMVGYDPVQLDVAPGNVVAQKRVDTVRHAEHGHAIAQCCLRRLQPKSRSVDACVTSPAFGYAIHARYTKQRTLFLDKDLQLPELIGKLVRADQKQCVTTHDTRSVRHFDRYDFSRFNGDNVDNPVGNQSTRHRHDISCRAECREQESTHHYQGEYDARRQDKEPLRRIAEATFSKGQLGQSRRCE